MTSTLIRDIVKSRTHHTDNTKVMYEVVSAARWAFMRAYNSENGPDLLLASGDENAIASRTRELDLSTLTTDAIFGVKQLWLKLSADSGFTPMIEIDSSHPNFRVGDNLLASATDVATGHPVYYDLVGVSTARFSPALPANSTLRCDYWKWAPDPDTATNDVLTDGADIPVAVHQAVMDKATAQVFAILDDSRTGYYEREAERKIVDAIYGLQRRTQTPARVKPFSARRGSVV